MNSSLDYIQYLPKIDFRISANMTSSPELNRCGIGTDLHVDISSIVHQQLKAQGPIGGDGCQVQGCAATLVGLVHVGAAVHQLIGHCLLTRVARHVQCGVAEGIWLVDLPKRTRAETERKGREQSGADSKRWKKSLFTRRLFNVRR